MQKNIKNFFYLCILHLIERLKHNNDILIFTYHLSSLRSNLDHDFPNKIDPE